MWQGERSADSDSDRSRHCCRPSHCRQRRHPEPSRRVLLGLGFLVLGTATLAPGQFRALFNPEVRVTIEHPPGLNLIVEKIAFGPSTGDCSEEIIQALISDFLDHGVEVSDRQNLDLILQEHNLNLGGYMDPASATELGRILGTSTLISVRGARCASEHKQQKRRSTRSRITRRRAAGGRRSRETVGEGDEKKDVVEYTYISTTTAHLRLSIQTVDLQTGRIFAARSIDRSPQLSKQSRDGYPEYPSEFEVMDLALASAVEEIHRMFFPWTEVRELTFFNGKKGQCDLKPAYQALKFGDQERALELSIASLETCANDRKVEKKQLSNAWYNAGLVHRILGNYDSALEHFQKARQLQPNAKIVSGAMKDCQDASEALEAMRRIEEKVEIQAQARQEDGEEKKREQIITNSDVIEMIKLQMSDLIVIRRIITSECRFDMSNEAIVGLTEAGVSDDVIVAMIENAAQ